MKIYSIKKILGSKMYLINKDGGVSKQLLKHGIREVGATKETIKLLKPGMTVIDIGANLGYYALLEARLVGSGFVYAIEPVKQNIETLKKSIELNNYKNIKVYQCAIGSDNGYQEMIISHKSNCGTLLMRLKSIDHAKDIIKVKTITLDNFCKRVGLEKIDFIRMDVEGYEVEVVKGMDKTVKLMPKGSILIIEIHPKAYRPPYRQTMEMLDTVEDYGFEVRKFVIANSVKEIRSFNELKKLFDNKYCPQVFFEKS